LEGILIFEVKGANVLPVPPDWKLAELELEEILMSSSEQEAGIPSLNQNIFGEPILLLKRQVLTKQGKRADIVGLDSRGNGVFIELKKEGARLGVETQALQYLANYATLKGQRFLAKFRDSEKHIDQFLGEYDVDQLNRTSRIILLAQKFDNSLLSLGEWLAQQNVAFRCIQYRPFKIGERSFLTFSTRFDRSREPVYQMTWEPRVPRCFWHNIGASPLDEKDRKAATLDEWWQFQLEQHMISTSFSNEPGDEGERILMDYVANDKVIAYASRYGAIGWGVVSSPSYRLITAGQDPFSKNGLHLHRLGGIEWQDVARTVREGIGADEMRAKFGLAHPIQTKCAINQAKAGQLITEMKKRFHGKAKVTSSVP